MKPSLEVLKLRAVVAGLEVQIAEQRMQFELLIREARILMIRRGDSTIQFDERGWLNTVNNLFPPDPEEKLLVKDVGWVSGAHGFTRVSRKFAIVPGVSYRFCDVDHRSSVEDTIEVTSIGPVIMGYYNVCWRVK